MVNLHTQFEMPSLRRSRDMKEDPKRKIGVIGAIQGHR